MSDPQREDIDPGQRAYRLRRRSQRRQAPTACAACELARPPFVYLEDGEHYCLACALLVATTEQSYPAAWRAGDITLEELLSDPTPIPLRVSNDRRMDPRSEYDLAEEPRAS